MAKITMNENEVGQLALMVLAEIRRFSRGEHDLLPTSGPWSVKSRVNRLDRILSKLERTKFKRKASKKLRSKK